MSHITLKQLSVFTAITRYKTLTLAAEHLCLSKAAVSLSLTELEKQLGHTVFDRVNNRLILNQEGSRLLPLADELLHRSQAIDVLFHSDKTLNGQLRLGASDTIGNQVLPYALREFRQQSGHQDQSVFISNTSLICQKLMAYELDIGLVEGKPASEHLIMQPWHHDEMCIICATSHPLASIEKLTLSDFDYTPWLLREAGSGSREFFLQTIAPHLNHWHEAFQLNTTEAIINSTAAGLGLGCLSRFAAQSALIDKRVVVLDLPLDMSRQFWLLIHKEKYQNPLLKAFISFCEGWEMLNPVLK